ncbi:MAG TPA: phosphoenolpyruvate synthase [Burkholderiaceae bacterium]|nr:phosphoenolpyruvate synthase [Burkholderiaceae bacterium]
MSNPLLATALVVPFEQLRMTDVEAVGGKNASLGEMISQLSAAGVRVPGGFATTAHAFRQFLAHGGLAARIESRLATLDTDDVRALAAAGAEIRAWIEATPFPPALEAAIRGAFEALAAGHPGASFAVRSSATAEDLPDASFAGQQETFLNVQGIEQVLDKMKEVFASLYNDRAISYRVHKGFAHADVALSAGVQRMVRSDLGAAGVMFTIDTESGFEDVVFITSSYGLGETVVQGAVNPDEFYVHKPALKAGKRAVIRRNLGSKLIKMAFASDAARAQDGRLVTTTDTEPEMRNRYSLSDEDVTELARYAVVIEAHYGRPMDIEWGKDGSDGLLYILQARPETVKSRTAGGAEQRYRLKGDRSRSVVLAEGRAIGQKIGTGPVRVVHGIADMDQVRPGDVLVTDMTDPNWEPVMKRAAAIVTNRGGRTCHAAIIARELGIPAVVPTTLDEQGFFNLAEKMKLTPKQLGEWLQQRQTHPEVVAAQYAKQAVDPLVNELRNQLAETNGKLSAIEQQRAEEQAMSQAYARGESMLHFTQQAAAQAPYASAFLREHGEQEFLALANNLYAEVPKGPGWEQHVLDAIEDRFAALAKVFSPQSGSTQQRQAPPPPNPGAAKPMTTVSNTLAQSRASVVDEETDWAALPYEERAARLFRQ